MNYETEKQAIIERQAAELAAFESEYKRANPAPVVSHTPGPWETSAVMTRVVVHRLGWNVPLFIADCDSLSYAPESMGEKIANARLIAAAPELLEALRRLLQADMETREMYGLPLCTTAQDVAREAIAKATGGNS